LQHLAFPCREVQIQALCLCLKIADMSHDHHVLQGIQQGKIFPGCAGCRLPDGRSIPTAEHAWTRYFTSGAWLLVGVMFSVISVWLWLQ
jgi:hypothetical protein